MEILERAFPLRDPGAMPRIPPTGTLLPVTLNLVLG
jgi:hypothetical protein